MSLSEVERVPQRIQNDKLSFFDTYGTGSTGAVDRLEFIKKEEFSRLYPAAFIKSNSKRKGEKS